MLGGQLAAGVEPNWSSAFAAGLGGSLAGIFLGSISGAAARCRSLEQPDAWASVPLQTDEMLVVTHGHGWSDSVRPRGSRRPPARRTAGASSLETAVRLSDHDVERRVRCPERALDTVG